MKSEGQAVKKSPLFKGARYEYWKQRIIVFFESCHIDITQ